jgi:3-methyladenine DNA glycosylase AlkD
MSFTPETFANAVRTALEPLADAERAVGMRAYMRDQFPFLGVSTPIRRQATRASLLNLSKVSGAELLAHVQALWALPEREYTYVGIDALARQVKHLGLEQIEGLLALAQQRSWWDSVDGLASVVGDVVRAARRANPDAQRCMDAALEHPVLWVRRIAMIHQLGWRTETDTLRLYHFARQLAPERDFFIRKAIGWALRDHARHDPEGVRRFLDQESTRLSALSVREAAKHLA